MALKKSPRGHIKPFTREGVIPDLKKTAKDTAMMKLALKQIGAEVKTLRLEPETENAEDAMIELELLAIQIQANARASIKKVQKTIRKIEKYLAENSE